MAILKCKMCGGDIKVTADQNFGTCESCGTTSTIPKSTDDQKANLFNRANHFRRMNDFDKATAAYESILNVDSSDSEAYWGLVLSKYGIEYVEDPVSHERIPTCHRVQKESILMDPDYLTALENADGSYAKGLYESEAKQIAEIQKGILAISSKEEPYDVFICYKETTEGGSRTKDSALAQDVYYQLTQERFKVFFSRITLEDKLGQQYEPYIFAALLSAKVMIVIGTKPEYLNAVWVKNEWSRYLNLMKQDRKKFLIPCYRDMDAYDLSEELSMLQSQDMSKIGFMQDLIRGVKKVIESEKQQERAPTSFPASTAPGVDSLYKRALLFLEDGDFQSATAYCDRILDISPEFAPAYVGKLCASLSVRKESDLVTASRPFSDNSNYKKAIRFDEVGYSAKLMGYNQAIEERVETTRKQNVYDTALNQKNKTDLSKTDSTTLRNCGTEYGRLAEVFDSITDFSDAGLQSAECKQISEEYLEKAKNKVEQDRIEAVRIVEVGEEEKRIAKERARTDWEQKIEASKIAEEQESRIEEARNVKRYNKIVAIAFISLVIMLIAIWMGSSFVHSQDYDKAEKLYAEGKYEAAMEEYAAAGSYRDSESKYTKLKIELADKG